MLRHESYRASAIDEGYLLSNQPRLFAEDTTDNLAVDWKMVADLTGDPDAVQSMAITLHTKPFAGQIKAYVTPEPYIEDGVAYTPHVVLGGSEGNLKKTNTLLRHELRHTVQEDRLPLYGRPGAISTVKLIGYAGLYLGVDFVQQPSATISAIGGAMLSLSALTTSKYFARVGLQLAEPHELDAYIFAARTRQSQLIYRR